MPYYVKTYLIHVPGFSGLFLSGVVSAATSTVSSIINSQAAILYVDVIVHRCQNAEKHVRWITRGTALALGISMTVYSMLCAHMGSLSRSFLMACNSLTAPFVGLCLIGVLFPFVRAKGAGVATIVAVVFQLFHIATIIKSGRKLTRMETSLDYCLHNHSVISWTSNTSIPIPQAEPDDSFLLSRMSYLWGSFFVIFATILLGVIVSAATGKCLIKHDFSCGCPSFYR
ncbi:sodium-coupled monocarboxylate transporter 1-like [Dermacentor andersoni]|uniref:sodium-coupled monocarboxylate transporter 1-like n=1 Tax=Dermacentor andersoni TaxID=34620 RepID=UPI00241761FD|nr:sodium-coupled monocarboxylate transporter 2-like [Dermacentor andersoni]